MEAVIFHTIVKMIITDKKINTTTTFGFLSTGAVFTNKGMYFMKTSIVSKNSSARNAVGLGVMSGEYYFFRDDELVVLCNAELIIT